MPIEDLLTDKGKLQQQRLAEKERRLQQRAQELRQVYKVNPKSELLVQERYILQGETTRDRLARPIGQVKQKTLEDIEKPSFKPTLNPVSIEMTANSGYNVYDGGRKVLETPYSPQEEALARFNSMYSGDDYSVDHGEPLLYEDLMRGSASKHHPSSGGGSGGGGNGAYESSMYDSSQSLAPQDAMYSKTQRWNDMRQQKIEKERRESERREREICTFKPKIDKYATFFTFQPL